MKKLLMTAAAVVLSGQAAMAAVTAQSLITELQGQGYSWIEVKRGPTQMKVEAVRGTEKLEFVVDAATGEVLAREVERADRDEMGRTGVEVADRGGNFVSATGRSLDDDDDHDDDHDDDDHDDDDDDGHGGSGSGSGSGAGGGQGGHGGSGHSGDDDDDDDDDDGNDDDGDDD